MQANISQKEFNARYSTSRYQDDRTNGASFQLAYNHLAYPPAVDPKDILLELQITGLRHEHHTPEDIKLTSEWAENGVIRGIKSTVRLVLNDDNPMEEKRIVALEMVPKDNRTNIANSEQTGKTRMNGEKSIAGPDWGGRLDLDAGPPRIYWISWATFQPREWNDCGRKDDLLRQFSCKIEDWEAEYRKAVIVTLIALSMLGGVLALGLLAFLSWRLGTSLWRQGNGAMKMEEEREGLLLVGNEELGEEEDKVMHSIVPAGAAATSAVGDHDTADEMSDDGRFGPFEHNIDYTV